jgi:hypothetical protein
VRAEFTFTSADPDVFGYRYGLTEDTTYFVAAGSGAGRPATVPVTMWTTSQRTLYVYSVDRAGNQSDGPRTYRFAAGQGSAAPRVRGDVDGDGLADVVAVNQRDADESGFLTLTAKGGGQFYEPPVLTWESGPNTLFQLGRMKTAKGDFNGDGRSDVAVFRDEGGARVSLWLFYANGVGFDKPTAPAWLSCTGCFELSRIKVEAGDVTGDGRDDLIHLYNYDNATYKLWTFVSTATGVHAPTVWWDNPVGNADWHRMKLIAGDFNGDRRVDVGYLYNYDGSLTRLWIHSSTGSAFAAGAVQWDSGPGNWDFHRMATLTGDFNRDGRSDLGVFYDYSNAHTKLWLFTATGAAMTCCRLAWDSGPGTWWWSGTKATVGDFNGDGRTDVGAFLSYPNARSKLWAFDGNSAAGVNAPVMRWDSGDWGLDWTRTTFH